MPSKTKSNVAGGSEVRAVLDVNQGAFVNRVCIGMPMTGLVRAEWAFSRWGQTIPTNWSHVEIAQFMSPHIPLKYQVADAENLIAKAVVEKDFEWLLFIEHDNILPPDCFVRMNQYMIEGKVPVVGGLYFTKSDPPEPLVYREIGRGYFPGWRMGDRVWVSGLPFGCTLIHGSLIKTMWKESPEYMINGQVTRRVFETPGRNWIDPNGAFCQSGGTSDLAWCARVIRDNVFAKSSWPAYARRKYPFLVDTGIFVRHIDEAGRQFPLSVPKRFEPQGKAREIK